MAEKRSFKDINIERITNLVNRYPIETRAVLARTTETRRLVVKLQTVDYIFSKIRNLIPYKISFQDAEKMFQAFKEAEEKIDEIEKLAESLNIVEKKFSDYKDQLKELVEAGKNVAEIAVDLGITEEKAKGWITNLKNNQ